MANLYPTAIIFHSVDWDGYTSAAIALKAYPEADLIPWTYGDPLPDVSKYVRVVLVDLTIYEQTSQSKDFRWMEDNRRKLIWIDHHPVIHEVPGKFMGRQEEGIGASWLTWMYFHKNYGVGVNSVGHIKYVATYDVFRKDGKYCKWADAWAYQLYLSDNFKRCTSSEDSIERVGDALYLMMDLEGPFLRLLEGFALEEKRRKKESEVFSDHALRVVIDGHDAWLIETDEQPSLIIRNHLEACDGDLFIIISENKKAPNGDYRASIRSSSTSTLTAQAFAEAHGGSGHVPAAGCTLSLKEVFDLRASAIISDF